MVPAPATRWVRDIRNPNPKLQPVMQVIEPLASELIDGVTHVEEPDPNAAPAAPAAPAPAPEEAQDGSPANDGEPD
ncbi:MAG TPA: hypothetical protein VGE07_01520 [Herpetosiphonaceae bacterium]